METDGRNFSDTTDNSGLNMDKWECIAEISRRSDRFGDKILQLLDKFNAVNTEEITEEQAFLFLSELRSDDKNMSYNIGIYVKAEGCGKYAKIAEPEFHDPTYNLGVMFRNCMDWEYKQSNFYECDFVIERVEHGLEMLKENEDYFRQFEPENKWGTVETAFAALDSLRNCILEQAEDIPLDCLYMKW